MRLVFAGTPEFSAAALRRLIADGHHIELVLTRPDQAAGRGMRMTASPVSEVAQAQGIPLFKPATLRDPLAVERIARLDCEAMVVAAYGLILPPDVLVLPKRGCLNIHASLLPRWRGAAPIHRSIEAGDKETGISIMQMDAGLDTGMILLRRELEIAPAETTATLTERLSHLGADAIAEALSRLPELKPHPQDGKMATYANKVTRAEARIDWALSAEVLERRLRAFDPFPGNETLLSGEPLKIWAAKVFAGAGSPGEVLVANSTECIVAAGRGALSLLSVQRPGGRRLPIDEFLRAAKLAPGTVMGR